MDTTTVMQLAQMTTAFYKRHAHSFSRTRQKPWEGWAAILQSLKDRAQGEALSLGDVGCGNGRFLQYLLESQIPLKQYVAVEENSDLLQETKAVLLKEKVHAEFSSQSIVAALLENQSILPGDAQLDVVVAFGILHHIPSQKLRQDCIRHLARRLKPNGLLYISFWQFADIPRYAQKVLSPQTFDIHPNTLETGDYMLGWGDDTSVARYCHSFSTAEITDLAIASGLSQVLRFTADGREHHANTYLVLHAREQ